MKKAIKVVLVLLAVVVVVLMGLMIYVSVKGPTKYANEAPDVTVKWDSSMAAEGARMASMLCVSCHVSENGVLEGTYMADTKQFGTIYSPNITHHDSSKLSGYTDGELMYLLRTGVKKDGYYSPPWMVKLPLLSDQDMKCIIAFLRSENPLLKPSSVVQPDPEPSFLAKALTTFVFRPLPYPSEPIPEPDKTDKVAWGKYLSCAKFDCYSCHSADFATVNLLEPEKTPGFFGGGNNLLRKNGDAVLSMNITMDKETGIGDWTEEQFIKCVKYGERPSGVTTQYPMMPYSNMTDEEVSAIWAYLQTVPVINNPSLKKS